MQSELETLKSSTWPIARRTSATLSMNL